MLKYIRKRLLYSVLTLWVLITITFFMMHALPGDPFIGSKPLTQEAKTALFAKYGLDQPVYIQYVKYLKNAIGGDFGESMVYQGQKISDMIAHAFPYSFDLGMRALIFAVIAGIFLGMKAALNNGRKWDRVAMAISALGVSVPSFILGTLLQYFIGIKLSGWTQQMWGFRLLPLSGWDSFKYSLMPSFVLGFGALASISRIMRTSLLDVSNMDYIKTACAKGLKKNQIVWRHMFRNAISPVITVLGPMAASILTGAFVVENIFNIPGMGKFFINGITSNDYPLIAGTTIFYGAFIIIANLLVDIAYMIIDPNVRLGKKKG